MPGNQREQADRVRRGLAQFLAGQPTRQVQCVDEQGVDEQGVDQSGAACSSSALAAAVCGSSRYRAASYRPGCSRA